MARRRAAAAVVGAVAALALVPAEASAGIRAASGTIDLDPGEAGAVAVACDPEDSAVSGGFRVGGFSTLNGGIAPSSSLRIGDAWSASGFNYNDTMTGTGTLTTFTYCDTSAPALARRTASVKLAKGVPDAVTATCPEGKRVVSGGFELIEGGADSVPFVYQSRKVRQRGWRVAGVDVGNDPGRMRAFAYCQRDAPRLRGISESAMTDPAEYHGTATVKPRCPDGTRSVSGGFNGHLNLTAMRGVVPLASKRARGGWKLSGWSSSATVDAELTGFAYCQLR